MSDEMSCVEIATPGGPDMLRPTTRPIPAPGPGEVLIRAFAAGVSRPDVLQRRGLYPPPPGVSDLPGLEVAGTIVELGAGVTTWAVGARVCALLAGGGYAEYVVAPAVQVLPAPPKLSFVEAAAIPENYFTVWTNVFERGHLRPGETLLVHGGASGIGTTAIVLARAFGARVFATAGSPQKCEACEKLGAEKAIDYKKSDFVAELKSATNGAGVDVVLDMVGGDYVSRDIDILAPDGRLVFIAFQKSLTGSINIQQVMSKRLVITGSTLRPRPIEEKGRIAEALRTHVWPRLERREALPVIDSIFPLAQAAKAHERLESGTHVGKIVLEV
ncbi:NAD(P)H-quinone oxidoreductase [Myxococcota bacterium]|nr:NAD(P)H-quinone oxidoreductase [Myxococcota bacterium]